MVGPSGQVEYSVVLGWCPASTISKSSSLTKHAVSYQDTTQKYLSFCCTNMFFSQSKQFANKEVWHIVNDMMNYLIL